MSDDEQKSIEERLRVIEVVLLDISNKVDCAFTAINTISSEIQPVISSLQESSLMKMILGGKK